ncbi:hypothetical protein GCM10020229_21090 [Kitasatospora albolonga]
MPIMPPTQITGIPHFSLGGLSVGGPGERPNQGKRESYVSVRSAQSQGTCSAEYR